VASAGGTLLDDRGWVDRDGAWSDTHSRATSLTARLSLRTPVLVAGVGADRRDQWAFSPARPTIVTESYTADATWRPLQLPELQLRAGRVNMYDRQRADISTTTDSAQFGTRYSAPGYEVRYLLGWTRATDHLHGFLTTATDQTALATRTDTLFNGRTSTYLSGRLQSRYTSTASQGLGGMVTSQQVPAAGFSAVLSSSAVSENVALSPNSAVVDGNTGTSAGVNVGFGLVTLGDSDPREVGARFPDLVTDVNTIWVWFERRDDRPLPTAVATALASSARVWVSEDNQRWTPVSLVGAVPSQLENRIEITIARTRARFVKVTLTPLLLGVTTDATFRELYVSELQFSLVLPVSEVPRRESRVSASATAIVRTTILKSPDFAHDLSASITRQTGPSLTYYALVNGLSLAHKLSRGVSASARAARLDSDDGGEHMGSWQWNAALAGNPLPTASWTLTYAGNANDRDQTTHTLSGFARAQWYEGISSQASAAGVLATQGLRETRSFQTSGTTSLAPNRYVTVSGGALYSRSLDSDPEIGDVLTQHARVDASVAVTPAPAVSGTGTVSRVLLGTRPTTFATVQLNFAPLRGDLQLALSYSKTLDTEADTTNEIFNPSLRWSIRRNISLTASYTFLETIAPVQTLTSRALTGTLLVVL
jgi:hypothetical protein